MQYIFIIFNLFILESLLSIDNAAVLALMVSVLPENQRNHALTYGMWGAFLARGACLLLAEWLIKIYWLKLVGAVYLLYLCYKHFFETEEDKDVSIHARDQGVLGLNLFWTTVIVVEFMDLIFSIDNVFAAVAMSSNIVLIWVGVFMGIITMRYVATIFSGLISKYPSLERSAFIVIGILGLKLFILGMAHYVPGLSFVSMFIERNDLVLGLVNVIVFIYPIIFKT